MMRHKGSKKILGGVAAGSMMLIRLHRGDVLGLVEGKAQSGDGVFRFAFYLYRAQIRVFG